MSFIPPINTVTNCCSVPKTGSSVGQVPFKKAVDIKPKEEHSKKKKEIPWKKILLGGALLVAFVEFILARNPVRRAKTNDFKHIFSTTFDAQERNFPMLPLRDDIVVTEVVKGNRAAEKLYPTVTKDAPKVAKYIKMRDKTARAEKYFIEGRFDRFAKGKQAPEVARQKFLSHLQKLRRETEKLYEENIRPLLDS